MKYIIALFLLACLSCGPARPPYVYEHEIGDVVCFMDKKVTVLRHVMCCRPGVLYVGRWDETGKMVEIEVHDKVLKTCE